MDGYPVMQPWIVAIICFCISFSLNAFFVFYKNSIGIFATEDKRRLHGNRTPLLGGIGIVAGLLTGFGLFYVGNAYPFPLMDTKFVIAALIVATALGLSDDIWEIKPKLKLAGQLIISGLLAYSVRDVVTPVDHLFGQGTLLSNSVKLFWAIGLLNAMNLIDGLDGLGAGLAMIALAFFGILHYTNTGEVRPFYWLTIASIGGFFVWNRNPAKIFMGEAGSLTLGIVLFIACMRFNGSENPYINFTLPLFAIAVPGMDTLMAIARRLMRKSSIMKGDREHLHHRLIRLGLSHGSTVKLIHTLAIYLCLIAYQMARFENLDAGGLGLVLVGLGINLTLLMTAERRLYSYLTNFANHMLKVLDQNNYGVVSSHMRMQALFNQGLPFIAFRLNMQHSVKSLLESAPARIQNFYSRLGNCIRGESALREIYFENSTSALIIQTLKAGDDIENIKTAILEDLQRLEIEEKLDLYLQDPDTIHPIPVSEYPGEVRESIERQYGENVIELLKKKAH